MARLLAQTRYMIGAFVVALVLAFALPALAQQPSSVNPSAQAVKEQQLLNALSPDDAINGVRAVLNCAAYTAVDAAESDEDHRAQGASRSTIDTGRNG